MATDRRPDDRALRPPASRTTTPEWCRLSTADAAGRLGVEPSTGLSEVEAADRLEHHGPNRLDEPEPRPAWRRFLDQFDNVLVYILVGAAVLSAAVGDLKDPIVIGIVLLVNAVLGYVQEAKAGDALAALSKMLEARVAVRRDGSVTEVSVGDLVPGDVVLLDAGSRVPADGRFLVARSLAVDESTLTGESVPVDKTVEPLDLPGGSTDVALGDRSNCGFMNTTVTRGRAEMLVTSTGMDTEVGRLAGMLASTEDPPTPLQVQLDALGKSLATIAGFMVLVVFAVAMYQGDDLNDAVLGAVALAVAAIPEGLPAVVTVTLAIGVSRMARERAIVKRLASVETLGSTTVICSDKTGTLTLNEMTATRVVVAGRTFGISGLGYGDDGAVHPLDPSGEVSDDEVSAEERALLSGPLAAAVLCNDAVIRTEDGATPLLVGDPTEGALVVAARKLGLDPARLRSEAPRLAELPFDSAVKYMATVHPTDGRASVLIAKGAPDVVLDRCTAQRSAEGAVLLDPGARMTLVETNAALAGQGLRVIAVASRLLDVPVAEDSGPDGDDAHGIGSQVHDLTLEALIAIVDPARPEAVTAVAECASAGIGVRMITGDHAATAGAIADRLGIPGSVVTGADLDDMTDEELAERIGGIGVCARVSPEHKVRVVRALQARGDIVAMTGDGVNDAPALKQAEIGVAMGVTGTDVTKEAGDLVLTDDNFATIVKAVERGRAIYENIMTFVRFQLTTNVAAVASILTARLAGYPAPFNPIQILFVNILADGPPAMSLGMDPPRPGVMEQPPRNAEDAILSRSRLVRIVVSAAVMTVTILAILARWTDASPAHGMVEDPGFTMAFTAFVLMQMMNALIVRSNDLSVFNRFTFTNRTFWMAVAGVVLAQILIVVVPFLQQVFGTTALTLGQWLVCVAATLPLLVVSEVRTLVVRLRGRGPFRAPTRSPR